MNLLDLPIEVGILVISYLDTKSKIILYGSCSALQCFFAPCHVKQFVLSRSTAATVRTFNSDLFINLGCYIQELNLSGISSLTAEILKTLIDGLKSLKTLDVTYTNIYLSDLPDICPGTVKRLAINFFKCPRKSFRDGSWDKCIEIFKQQEFKEINLILFEFLDSDIPLLFLKNTPLIETVTITVADNYKDFWELEDMPLTQMCDKSVVKFSQLSYIFRECRVTHKTSKCLKGIVGLDFKKIEFVFVMYLEQIIIYVSPVLSSIFSATCSDLRIEISPYLPTDFMLDGNIIFKAWNKSTTVFDDAFFEKLLKDLHDYFPSYVCMHEGQTMNITKAKSDWYCIDDCDGFETKLDYLPNNITLTNFCRKEGAIRHGKRPISLSPNSTTIKNITFIRLSNISISGNFFTSLFEECSKLKTLDIYVEKRDRPDLFRGYTASLAVAIRSAQNLKNFKLTSEDIEYELLFAILSQCVTLENIHVSEYERSLDDTDVNNVNNMLTLIENCKELYSFFIETDMSPESLTLMMSPLRDLSQKLERDHLVIEVCDCYRGWNPFANVFNPSPLHILD